MRRLAVLWSDASLRAKIARARRAGALYRGLHLGQPYHWLKGADAYLGVNGARHCLWRLGLIHELLDESALLMEDADGLDAVFVPEAEALTSATVGRLETLARSGCWVIVGGATNLPDALLGVMDTSAHAASGYVSVVAPDGARSVVSPPGYTLHRTRTAPDALGIGILAEDGTVEGVPPRSLGTPAVVRCGRVVWLPMPFFEYLGGLLQAHVDWWPLRARLGGDAIGYVDGLCQLLASWLRLAGAGALLETRVSPWGAYANALIVRHDTDDSDDASFWELECARGLAATYPILVDARAGAWADRLRSTPEMEVALHYRSNREGVLERLRCRLRGGMPRRDDRAVAGEGLLRQVRAARPVLGRVPTVHRHYHYMDYPEGWLALDALYAAEPLVLGAGSLSRFDIRRWGGEEALTITPPHPGVPFWFPVRATVATAERHEALRGWDSTALIEPGMGEVQKTLDLAQALPGGCFTWVFHPAHASRSKLAPDGRLETFRQALDALDGSWWVTTAAKVYERLNRWTRLAVRKTHNSWELVNLGDEPITDVVVRTPAGTLRTGVIEPGMAEPAPSGSRW